MKKNLDPFLTNCQKCTLFECELKVKVSHFGRFIKQMCQITTLNFFTCLLRSVNLKKKKYGVLDPSKN